MKSLARFLRVRHALLLVLVLFFGASCASVGSGKGRLHFDVLDGRGAVVDGWDAGVSTIGLAADQYGNPAVAIAFEPDQWSRLRAAFARAKGSTIAVLDPATGKAIVSGNNVEPIDGLGAFTRPEWTGHPELEEIAWRRLRELSAAATSK